MLIPLTDFDRTFSLLDELRNRMDRVWEEVEPNYGLSDMSASAWPRMTVQDSGSEFVISAEVPGMEEKDVELTTGAQGLTISGERRVIVPEGYSVHRQERGSVRFTRNVGLPGKVDASQANAVLKDGVLTITLPRAVEAQPKRISVRAT